MSINYWKKKWLYNEWSTDTCYIYNVDETWKHYAKWKKPVTKDHKLYEMSIYTKCPEYTNSQR